MVEGKTGIMWRKENLQILVVDIEKKSEKSVTLEYWIRDSDFNVD